MNDTERIRMRIIDAKIRGLYELRHKLLGQRRSGDNSGAALLEVVLREIDELELQETQIQNPTRHCPACGWTPGRTACPVCSPHLVKP